MSQIAIDGPAGAGKSTVAREISKKLGFMYVDTGAMYRTIALECLSQGIDVNDEKAVEKAVESSEIAIKYLDSVQHMYIGKRDVSQEIRKEEVGKAASVTARYGAVRKKLTELQRELGREYNVVMDGRDIGTVVFPDADLKIFLTASVKCRAQRRYKELSLKGESCSLEEIEKDILKRDSNDAGRSLAPLAKASDAVEVDSSDMTIEQVVKKIMELYSQKK